MHYSSGKKEAAVREENISYYNEIANSYDQLLKNDDSNKFIRQKVKEKFINHVQPGSWVLDFGGGTGIDLQWLLDNNYNIIFCEPSAAMREKAIKYTNDFPHSKRVTFLDTDKTDFTNWHNQNPFARQVDAVLSNFAVINNIQDIKLLFENLVPLVRPGGNFILIFLDIPFRKRLKWHRRNAIKSLIFRTPFSMFVWNKEYRQTVFVHTLKKIKQASAPYFHYRSSEFLGGFGFTLLHLVKK
ncbi:MAG TPA: class I SAM-dependent methyltransferase [Parafilimonas sp.]|nr:class I SAM-dependent methyltransferase [Parafilimonas sp.]